ncbi:protein kinase domain-containing protein [Archangium lipolyticum]|uniref:protein kinase domain-containing protein n=1 Tax=Archangium lipolyticum TaxID=2970465 RepID=UPI0027D47A08|nr:SUMF1/EgtB/PvdO family nonheme iron enzyme [Archangium lipolyticum]
MLCYRCGSPVPDNSESCATCGLKLAGAAPGGAAPRRRPGSVEAPYKPGDVFAKRYAIREVLGPGPVGHVFRALDQEMDVEVALKIINPRLVQMPEERTQFSLALRAGKKLTHPHHVRVYEEGEERNRPFFTTQLLEGMTLRRMMEQRAAQGQRFTPKEVEPLLAQLVEALDSAHKYGPHSDLKPENIIVLPDMLKVTDYGLALGIPRLPFIQAQKGWRTACYVAPEYAEGGELDTRMDLYSLAVIVGELLTGQTPEEGQVPELLAYESELPPGLEALYRRATNANLLARPKTAGEFLAEYSAALSRPRPPGSVKPAGAAQTPVPPRPRPKPVPFSLTAELATASNLGSNMPPPPVPTTELPSLAAPTIQVPVVGGGSPTREAPRATTLEAPRETLEAPISSAPTLDMPVSGGPTEPLSAASIAQRVAAKSKEKEQEEEPPPPDATQPLDAETLARIMGNAHKPAPAPGPAPKPRPAPRAEPRPAPQAAPSRTAPRAAPVPVAAPRSRFPLGLVLLTIAGLGVGVAVGYGLLWKPRQPSEAAVQGGGAGPGGAEPSGVVAPVGACPQGMRLVSGGAFKMGTDTPTVGMDELPLASVQVASFCIDEFEYPNKAGEPPRVGVTWEEAKAECETLGKRLCTEPEWEKACKGPGNARFPYGSTFDVEKCNTAIAPGQYRELTGAGSFAGCRSGYGIADLSGNVAEWTDSRYGDTQDRTLKGGSFERPEYAARCAARKNGVPSARSHSVGFRCCAGVSR